MEFKLLNFRIEHNADTRINRIIMEFKFSRDFPVSTPSVELIES